MINLNYRNVIFLLIGFSGLAHAQVSQTEAIRIFKMLSKVAKLKEIPKFTFTKEKDFNGYTSEDGIEITYGMLKFTNKAELAGVIGHEITHWVHKDYYHSGSKYQELRADREGLYYAEQLGYGRCSVLKFMVNAAKSDGWGDPGDGVHPSWTIRYKQLGKGC